MNRPSAKQSVQILSTIQWDTWVLVGALAGLIALAVAEWMEWGLTTHTGLMLILPLVLAVAVGTLIQRERRAAAVLRDLRTLLGTFFPEDSASAPPSERRTSPEALGQEVRTLIERWKEDCAHCRHDHDTQMVQAEHLASMGELAAGVAHEIRNPLAGIAGAIEIITRDLPADHPDREVLADLRAEVRRIEKVLSDLLAYARPKPPHFGPASLKETVARTLQIVRQQTGDKKVEFSIQIPVSLPSFLMDSEQLEQVLLNLVLNGIQALDGEGRISIAAALKPAGAPGHSDYIEISVSDTGRGIAPENLERIFRPFYTTRRGGTGLGLSLCQRIVRQHGGTIMAESVLNQGSRFVVRLPRHEVEVPR